MSPSAPTPLRASGAVGAYPVIDRTYDVRPARLVDDPRAHVIELLAEDRELLRHRAMPELRPAVDHDARRLALGVRIDDADFAELTQSEPPGFFAKAIAPAIIASGISSANSPSVGMTSSDRTGSKNGALVAVEDGGRRWPTPRSSPDACTARPDRLDRRLVLRRIPHGRALAARCSPKPPTSPWSVTWPHDGLLDYLFSA